MKEGIRVYGKKHERKYIGRLGRKSVKTWLRGHKTDLIDD